MPHIVKEIVYDGAQERIDRLGLGGLLEEVRTILTKFDLRVREEKDANGGAALRKLLDSRFEQVPGWEGKKSGDIDWTKCRSIDGVRVCVGVEVQVSARSDMIAVDIIHLGAAIRRGGIDVGVLIVPSDYLSRFLTDRGPSIGAAERHMQAARADDLPLLLIALEHDGPGKPLAKQEKRSRKARSV